MLSSIFFDGICTEDLNKLLVLKSCTFRSTVFIKLEHSTP